MTSCLLYERRGDSKQNLHAKKNTNTKMIVVSKTNPLSRGGWHDYLEI